MNNTIVKDEVLFTHEFDNGRGAKLTLKRAGSNNKYFYYFVDQWGITRVEHASRDLNELIKQIEHEKNVHIKHYNELKKINFEGYPESTIERFKRLFQWYDNIINDMKKLL